MATNMPPALHRASSGTPIASGSSGDGAVDIAHGLGEDVAADPLAEVVAVLVAVLGVGPRLEQGGAGLDGHPGAEAVAAGELGQDGRGGRAEGAVARHVLRERRGEDPPGLVGGPPPPRPLPPALVGAP